MWVCVCLYIHINKHKMHINWNVPKVGAVGRFMVCRRGGLQLSQVLMETEYGQYGVCRYEKKVYRGHWRVRIAWSTIIIDCTSCNSMRRVCGRFQVQVPTGTKFTYQKKKERELRDLPLLGGSFTGSGGWTINPYQDWIGFWCLNRGKTISVVSFRVFCLNQCQTTLQVF